MTIIRVYNHVLGTNPHSTYSFAFNVAECSFLRTTAAHSNDIWEEIMNRLSSDKCLLSFMLESVFKPYSNTCRV
jgi:hypothetical protein